MIIEQFEDKALSHYSYAILSECAAELILIDPSRDLSPYIAFAQTHKAKIIGIIETHPHADFISGHTELAEITGATIYCSKLLGAKYSHVGFDAGDSIQFGKIRLRSLNTPGHSPDSISVVLEHEGKDKAVFTGDTLFIGDCGRPDLREQAGNITAQREELAKAMYHSLRDQYLLLADDVLVYPAHGAGSLCGKALSKANSSTIGAERIGNWSLQEQTEEAFVKELTADQPFIPAYFPYDVEINKNGAKPLAASIKPIKIHKSNPQKGGLLVDTRSGELAGLGHFPNSIRLMLNGKFETWLGTIIAPQESFSLLAENEKAAQEAILRAAKIGYEAFIQAAYIPDEVKDESPGFDIDHFRKHPEAYTIVDVRNREEAAALPLFKNSILIPLPELRASLSEIPNTLPIVVHCAGGYRSAAGSSIVQNAFAEKVPIYDLSTAVKGFELP